MATIFPQTGARHAARTAPVARLAGRISDLAGYLVACFAVARERQFLARLDARLLRDAGIDPRDAAREIARGFWDIPPERRWWR